MNSRSRLIDEGLKVIRSRGYAGFSYADLAAVVALKKPTIHHHFPTKEDLGRAVVTAYDERFRQKLAAIAEAESEPRGKLQRYAKLYRHLLADGSPCLCGALAQQDHTLPPAIQRQIREFFEHHVTWIATVLREHEASSPPQEVRRKACVFLASLQGAALLARALGDLQVFESTAQAALDSATA